MTETAPLVTAGMREYQVEAIRGLEQSLAWARPRALIHMATGAGKTFTACARFADLVALVRFALEQQAVLAPFADSVQERFEQWLQRKEEGGVVFTGEQRAWLGLIRDHIATSLSIEPDDFEYSPFNQRGGLGKAHQLFGAELPLLLDELNEALAA